MKAGFWTPEVVVENPDAVTGLHKEYARAGADVTQAFTFYASEDKLKAEGNTAAADFGVARINNEACRLAWEIAAQYGTLVAAGLSPTPSYREGKGKQAVQREFKAQTDIFASHDVDFMIVEVMHGTGAHENSGFDGLLMAFIKEMISFHFVCSSLTI